MTAAAIFPGQGAQSVGMGRDVVESSRAAAEVYDRAGQILGFDLRSVCFDGPADRLNSTDLQQPAIFVTSVALFRAAQDAGRVRPGSFSHMGGLSLGEYTALHLAGAVAFDDALRLVHERGRLMQRAAEAHPGGMVSIMGLDEPAVLALCEHVAPHGRVAPANFNAPGQIVISGELPACDAAARAVEQFGGKAVPLKVAGAFHSDLMRSAADGLRPHLDACRFGAPALPVVSNVDARYHRDPDSIRESLYRQVFSPVRWSHCVQRLIADGCGEFCEIGPGKTLTGLMRRIDRDARAVNISRAADLQPAG